jgi:hypothetical protein
MSIGTNPSRSMEELQEPDTAAGEKTTAIDAAVCAAVIISSGSPRTHDHPPLSPRTPQRRSICYLPL